MNLNDYINQRQYHFPVTQEQLYFDYASTAPLPLSVAEAIKSYVDRHMLSKQDDCLGEIERTRRLVAKMIGANPREIFFVSNTSVGLDWIAMNYSWQPYEPKDPNEPKDLILYPQHDFPANVIPWDKLEELGLCQSECIELGRGRSGLTPDILRDVLKNRKNTRLVSVSAVHNLTGFRLSLEKIGDTIHEFNKIHNPNENDRKILFCVDAIQALGTNVINVKDSKIDLLTAGGHKLLLSPKGSGFVYVRKELIEEFTRRAIGWHSFKDRGKSEEQWLDRSKSLDENGVDYTDNTLPIGNNSLLGGAQRFEISSRNVLPLLGFREALKIFDLCGFENIENHIQKHVGYLIEEIENSQHFTVLKTGDNQLVKRSSIIPLAFKDWNPLVEKKKAIKMAKFFKAIENQDIPRVGKKLAVSLKFWPPTDNLNYEKHPPFGYAGVPFLRLSLHFYTTRNDIDELFVMLEYEWEKYLNDI